MAVELSINKQRIKELVDIAIHEDESLAKTGIEATFRSIVEPLNDSFDANDRDVYYDVFSYVIHLIRELPEAGSYRSHIENISGYLHNRIYWTELKV